MAFFAPGPFVGTTNSSDVFTNLLHDFFPAWAVEKENKLLLGPKIIFFSVSKFKKKSWQIFIKKLVDYEFETGENNWWVSFNF